MISSKLILIAGLASLVSYAWCGCPSLEDIDVTAEQMLFIGNRELIIPSDPPNLVKYCQNYESSLNNVGDYINNCLKEEFRPLAAVVKGMYDQHFQKQCKDTSYAEAFITHSQCFLNGDILEEFHQCSDKWFHLYDQIKTIDPSLRIATSCCLFNEFQDCVADKNTKLCHDANAQFWRDTYQEMSTDTFQQYCKGYVSAAECTTNYPADVWKRITDKVNAMNPEQLKVRNRFRSVFFEVLNMVAQYKL